MKVSEVTPHNQAIYEAGKDLLKNSVATGKEFSKFMIGISSGSIPIYLSLIEFILPENFTAGTTEVVRIGIPSFLFIASSVVFSIAFYPKAVSLSLDVIQDIETNLDKIISKRRMLNIIGLVIHVLGVLIGIVFYLKYLSL